MQFHLYTIENLLQLHRQSLSIFFSQRRLKNLYLNDKSFSHSPLEPLFCATFRCYNFMYQKRRIPLIHNKDDFFFRSLFSLLAFWVAQHKKRWRRRQCDTKYELLLHTQRLEQSSSRTFLINVLMFHSEHNLSSLSDFISWRYKFSRTKKKRLPVSEIL